jgi:hypothetical protein
MCPAGTHRPPGPVEAGLRHPRGRVEPGRYAGGAGDGRVPVPRLQDRLRGAHQGAAGGATQAACRSAVQP